MADSKEDRIDFIDVEEKDVVMALEETAPNVTNKEKFDTDDSSEFEDGERKITDSESTSTAFNTSISNVTYQQENDGKINVDLLSEGIPDASSLKESIISPDANSSDFVTDKTSTSEKDPNTVCEIVTVLPANETINLSSSDNSGDEGENLKTDSKEQDFQTAAASKENSCEENGSETTEDQDLEAKNENSIPSELDTDDVTSEGLDSEEYKQSLMGNDDVVKDLDTDKSVLFENSTAGLEATKEPVKQRKDFDWESYDENSEAKRKSNQSDLDEVLESIKKFKILDDMDVQLKNKNLCCVEEEFRIAFEETNGNSELKRKYNFQSKTGNDVNESTLCKHEIAKLEAIAENVFSKRYSEQLANVTESHESESQGFSNNESSDADTKALAEQSYSARTVEANVEISAESSSKQSREQNSRFQILKICYGHLKSSEAVKSLKNAALFVIYGGSLVVALAIAKLFGVSFPIKNFLRRDSKALDEHSKSM